MIWTVIGVSAAFLTTFGFVPQSIKMWRTKSVRDISLGTLVQFSFGVSFWCLYGIHLKDTILISANAVSLSTLLVALGLYLYCRRRSASKVEGGT